MTARSLQISLSRITTFLLELIDEVRIVFNANFILTRKNKRITGNTESYRHNGIGTGKVLQAIVIQIPSFLLCEFYDLIPELTAKENILLPSKLAKKGKTDISDTVKKLGVENLLGRYPSELSGGQQQRVAIARALVNDPSVLLCDEPTGNLDSKTSSDVIGLLKRTSVEFHQTIVMITHNDDIARLADRIIRIEDGKITGGMEL